MISSFPVALRRLGPMALLAATVCLSAIHRQAQAEELRFPLLVPITGFLSLEGSSQRNGALLAVREHRLPEGISLNTEVVDTGTSPEAAMTALERVGSRSQTVAVGASMLGTQMLAMLPLAAEYGLPLITVSGTAAITELGNPFVFRFFPGDAVTKQAHARFVVEERKLTRPAIISQTTAYGQSGRTHLLAQFRRLGATVVHEEAIEPGVKDMLPVLSKAMARNPDVLVLHLHSGPTALLIRQVAAMGITVPIVAGSAMHQPSTAALLEPAELKGVCAETASSPVSGGSPAMERFTAAYRNAFGTDPDAFALGQYDGTRMVLAALTKGARTPSAVRDILAHQGYEGEAMSYRSDGKGNMAHSAMIICYDGNSRIPTIVKRYIDLASEAPPRS